MNRKDRRAAGKRGERIGRLRRSLFALAVQHHQAGQLSRRRTSTGKCWRATASTSAACIISASSPCREASRRRRSNRSAGPIAIDGRNPECHYNIAFAFQSLGRLNEAVVALSGGDPAQARLRRCLYQSGQRAAADRRQRARRSRPTSASSHSGRPQRRTAILPTCSRADGRLDDAVTQFPRALTLKPDLVAAHNNLANALIAQGRSDEALTHLRQRARARSEAGRGLRQSRQCPAGARQAGRGGGAVSARACRQPKFPRRARQSRQRLSWRRAG